MTRGSSDAQLTAELGAGGHTTSHVSADVGSPAGVRSAADEIRVRLDRGDLPPLRGFVGNAGMQYTNALTEGADGFEATFAVNVLANRLFVRLLQDHFTAAARMYSTSKQAVVCRVHAYARRLPVGIAAVAYNPGSWPGRFAACAAPPTSVWPPLVSSGYRDAGRPVHPPWTSRRSVRAQEPGRAHPGGRNGVRSDRLAWHRQFGRSRIAVDGGHPPCSWNAEDGFSDRAHEDPPHRTADDCRP